MWIIALPVLAAGFGLFGRDMLLCCDAEGRGRAVRYLIAGTCLAVTGGGKLFHLGVRTKGWQ